MEQRKGTPLKNGRARQPHGPSGKFVAKAVDAIGMGEGKEFDWRKRARYLGLHLRA
jgi:hypothetical protein